MISKGQEAGNSEVPITGPVVSRRKSSGRRVQSPRTCQHHAAGRQAVDGQSTEHRAKGQSRQRGGEQGPACCAIPLSPESAPQLISPLDTSK